MSAQEQLEKEEMAKLLIYESSAKPAGEKIALPEYISRMEGEQKDIYYLAAPSRELAETSPYFEALKVGQQLFVLKVSQILKPTHCCSCQLNGIPKYYHSKSSLTADTVLLNIVSYCL